MKKRVTRIHKRKDISDTFDKLMSLGFMKGSLFNIFGNKNYHVLESRHSDNHYTKEDIHKYEEFKENLALMLHNKVPSIYLNNLFKRGLLKRYVYRNILGISSYQFFLKLPYNDFTVEELNMLEDFRKQLKNVIK